MTVEQFNKAKRLLSEIADKEKMLSNLKKRGQDDWVQFNFGNGGNAIPVGDGDEIMDLVIKSLSSIHQRDIAALKSELETL